MPLNIYSEILLAVQTCAIEPPSISKILQPRVDMMSISAAFSVKWSDDAKLNLGKKDSLSVLG